MKKPYLILCISMILCLTACEADKNNEAAERDTEAFEVTTDTPFELTEQAKTFLARMCKTLTDFDSQTTKDEEFWWNFIFYSYTGEWEGVDIEQVYREDLGFDETVVKVSLQEVEAYAKLVYGVELPDIKPSFEDMKEGQTSCYYQDGYYYIGVSDFPNFQFTFADYEELDDSIVVRYTVGFEDQSNAGTVSLTLVPEANENGFIIAAKRTEFFQ